MAVFGRTHVRIKGVLTVKAKIHPRYQKCNVHCACGNTFVTRSTVGQNSRRYLQRLPPFFTGKQKFRRYRRAGSSDSARSSAARTASRKLPLPPRRRNDLEPFPGRSTPAFHGAGGGAAVSTGLCLLAEN